MRVAPNVGYFLPKNVDVGRVEELAAELCDGALELEECVGVNSQVKALMAYYGFTEVIVETLKDSFEETQNKTDTTMVTSKP